MVRKLSLLVNFAVRHKIISTSSSRLLTASLFMHAKEKASEASAKHVGVGVGVCERSEQ